MKIAFFSNFLNHHQLPLCEEFLKQDKVQFVFVACSKIPAEREKMGYKRLDDQLDYVLKAYENEKAAEQIALTFDVCIFGADCEQYVQKRMEAGLLSFRYIERIFKKGRWRYLIPKVRKKIQRQYLRYKNKDFYILCASGFTSSDLSCCGFPASKCLQWGYFPQQSRFSFEDLVVKKPNSEFNLIYVGRLLKLKNVDTIIKAFSIVAKKHNNLNLTIIGDGPEMVNLKKLADKKCHDKVSFYGYQSIDDTRKIMEQSHILILASNFYEGWGAVINESMSSACIPICSHSVGSAPVLIDNGINGYIFRKGNSNELARKINNAISDIDNMHRVSKNAYNSIKDVWNAKIAVERFCKICSSLLSKNKTDGQYFKTYTSGPCSNSKLIRNNWYRGH